MSKRNSNARGRMATTTTNKTVRRRRPRDRDDLHEQGMSTGMVVARPFTSAFSPDRPGHASVRATFEAIGTQRNLKLAAVGTGGFSDWNPQAVSILTPFCYFRIIRARFVTQVTGGAASLYTVAANITNDPLTHDTSALGILNDDHAGVANAVRPLVLETPVGYFQQGALKWYPTVSASEVEDTSCGNMSMVGYGGTDGSTLLGWHTVDLEFEFHTLR